MNQKKRAARRWRPFFHFLTISVFVLVSLVVVGQSIRFAKPVENSCHEVRASFSNAAGGSPTLLKPRPKIENVLRSFRPSTRCIRCGGHSKELHHNLHWFYLPLITPLWDNK